MEGTANGGQAARAFPRAPAPVPHLPPSASRAPTELSATDTEKVDRRLFQSMRSWVESRIGDRRYMRPRRSFAGFCLSSNVEALYQALASRLVNVLVVRRPLDDAPGMNECAVVLQFGAACTRSDFCQFLLSAGVAFQPAFTGLRNKDLAANNPTSAICTMLAAAAKVQARDDHVLLVLDGARAPWRSHSDTTRALRAFGASGRGVAVAKEKAAVAIASAAAATPSAAAAAPASMPPPPPPSILRRPTAPLELAPAIPTHLARGPSRGALSLVRAPQPAAAPPVRPLVVQPSTAPTAPAAVPAPQQHAASPPPRPSLEQRASGKSSASSSAEAVPFDVSAAAADRMPREPTPPPPPQPPAAVRAPVAKRAHASAFGPPTAPTGAATLSHAARCDGALRPAERKQPCPSPSPPPLVPEPEPDPKRQASASTGTASTPVSPQHTVLSACACHPTLLVGIEEAVERAFLRAFAKLGSAAATEPGSARR